MKQLEPPLIIRRGRRGYSVTVCVGNVGYSAHRPTAQAAILALAAQFPRVVSFSVVGASC